MKHDRISRALTALSSTAVLALIATATPAAANSISDVENARAKDRAGYSTTRQDREMLRRYGRNDGGYGYRYRDDYGYDDGPYGGVSIYIGPRHHYYDRYRY